jgi:hypothetical protein
MSTFGRRQRLLHQHFGGGHSMIKLTAYGFNNTTGAVSLTFQYSDGAETKTVIVDKRDVEDRLVQYQILTGVNASLQDLKHMVIQLVNELRAGKEPIMPKFNYTSIIGVDFEN